MKEAGFEIQTVERGVDPKVLEDLRTLRVQADFRKFSPDDLATLTTQVVARPV
jgi:hypothetical protein